MTRLNRQYGSGRLHFITTSCFQRRALLADPHSRDMFLEVMEQVRRRYRFVVVGYVVMPEHLHLLLSEPKDGDPSTVMQVLKQSFARKLSRHTQSTTNMPHVVATSAIERHVWQPRFYDFVIYTAEKRGEKLHYMHWNPVKRGLVLEPEQWIWSSFRCYRYEEQRPVLMNEKQIAEMKVRKIS